MLLTDLTMRDFQLIDKLQGPDFTIEKCQIRDVLSDGQLCSALTYVWRDESISQLDPTREEATPPEAGALENLLEVCRGLASQARSDAVPVQRSRIRVASLISDEGDVQACETVARATAMGLISTK